jgi:hypothetical protein
MRENCIEWLNGQDRVTVTLSQGRFINKVKKLAEKHKEVEIVKENEDGTLLAKLPLKFIKISAPRQITEEQREQARERFNAMHKTNKWCESDSLDLY